MPQGRNKALPMETREFPDYVYREYPKMLGDRQGCEKDDPTRHVIAESAEHEKQLREQHSHLPPFVAPPTSMAMSDFRENMLELQRLRDENRRLKLAAGEVVTDEQPRTVEARPVEAPDRGPPGTSAELLAAGEHPKGDPWADQPENAIAAPVNPSIKPAGASPPSIKPQNKLSGGKR